MAKRKGLLVRLVRSVRIDEDEFELILTKYKTLRSLIDHVILEMKMLKLKLDQINGVHVNDFDKNDQSDVIHNFIQYEKDIDKMCYQELVDARSIVGNVFAIAMSNNYQCERTTYFKWLFNELDFRVTCHERGYKKVG